MIRKSTRAGVMSRMVDHRVRRHRRECRRIGGGECDDGVVDAVNSVSPSLL